jgi:crossover junction endodeoxyribonuclease RuvC
MKRVLALDLASSTGWAVQRSNGSVATGVVCFLSTLNPGSRWIRFYDWLLGTIRFEETQRIIFEEPFIHMKHRSGIGLSYGFKTIVELLAARNDIPCHGIAPTVLKKWATGHGNATKNQMAIFARSMGWKLTNDNEVDARFLLHFAQEKIRRSKNALVQTGTEASK